jgi:LacI family transcriptional regulator
MAIRLQDIADDLGLSKVTISKVLRGSPDIGEATRERVKQRMRELNYQPNYQARALAGGKTYSIGLIVPDLVHPFFAEVAKGLSSVMRESGRVVLLGSSEEDPAIEQQQIRAFLQRGVDALLLASCQPSLEELGEKPLPCVLVDRNFPEKKLHFIGIGRKRIAHIASDAASTGRERLRAFRTTLQSHHLRVPEKFIITRERFEETGDRAGYQAMRQLLAEKKPPDAVFCYNDLSAIGAMAAAMDAGLRIPHDIAFVGCGNFRYANYLRVPLTSIDQSAQSMGATAGKLALELIANTASGKKKILLEPSLIVRDSSVLGTSGR